MARCRSKEVTTAMDAYLKFIEDDFLGGQRVDPATDGGRTRAPTFERTPRNWATWRPTSTSAGLHCPRRCSPLRLRLTCAEEALERRPQLPGAAVGDRSVGEQHDLQDVAGVLGRENRLLIAGDAGKEVLDAAAD